MPQTGMESSFVVVDPGAASEDPFTVGASPVDNGDNVNDVGQHQVGAVILHVGDDTETVINVDDNGDDQPTDVADAQSDEYALTPGRDRPDQATDVTDAQSDEYALTPGRDRTDQEISGENAQGFLLPEACAFVAK